MKRYSYDEDNISYLFASQFYANKVAIYLFI